MNEPACHNPAFDLPEERQQKPYCTGENCCNRSVDRYPVTNEDLCAECIMKDYKLMEENGDLNESNRQYIKEHITTTIHA